MGVYVYAVGRGQHITAEINGKPETVYALRYHHKPYWSLGGERQNERWMRQIERMEEGWGAERPRYITIIYKKFEDGNTVYEWQSKDISWWDTDKVPGTKVGELHRDGKRWSVGPHRCYARFATNGGTHERWAECGSCRAAMPHVDPDGLPDGGTTYYPQPERATA